MKQSYELLMALNRLSGYLFDELLPTVHHIEKLYSVHAHSFHSLFHKINFPAFVQAWSDILQLILDADHELINLPVAQSGKNDMIQYAAVALDAYSSLVEYVTIQLSTVQKLAAKSKIRAAYSFFDYQKDLKKARIIRMRLVENAQTLLQAYGSSLSSMP